MTELTIKNYISKPTQVEAVQITPDNMASVAKWCKGEVLTKKDEQGNIVKYIKVKVWRAQNDNQSQGTVGTWILKRGTGFKVYTDKAFKAGYTDGDSIPMVENDPSVTAAVFDQMVQERTEPRETRIVMGDHVETIRTPAKGVPLRGVDYGYPTGSIVMFHEPQPTDIPSA